MKCAKCGSTESKRWIRLFPAGVSCLSCEIARVDGILRQLYAHVLECKERIHNHQTYLKGLEEEQRRNPYIPFLK
jgi:hypothetical protein